MQQALEVDLWFSFLFTLISEVKTNNFPLVITLPNVIIESNNVRIILGQSMIPLVCGRQVVLQTEKITKND